MRKNKRKNKILFLTLILLGVTIGFAALATTLKIDGIANILKPTWKVYWANPQVTTGSATSNVPEITAGDGESERTKVVWTTTLALPGDFYEFTIDAVNTGSVDAMVTGIFPSVSDGNGVTALPDYIDYSVTYDDGTEVEVSHVLAANSTQKYKIRVSYDMQKMTSADIEAMPQGGLSYTFSYQVTYGLLTDQATKPNLRLGEYFVMCPDKAEATTTTPGFSGSTPTSDQCLWRVINLNPDGTVDAVSHYTSTNEITIAGEDGYTYYVAGLQDIASCYAKRGYTVKTRMMGYDGQTPVIDDTYHYNGATFTPPSTTSTPSPQSGEGQEYENGLLGDTLYLRDYQLVLNVYGYQATVGAKNKNNITSYLLASRSYRYINDNNYNFGGYQIINSNYSPLSTITPRRLDIAYTSVYWRDYNSVGFIRPIITIRSGLHKESGKGSESNPYILNSRDGWFLANNKEPMENQKFEYWENGSKIMSGWRNLNDFSGNPNTYYFEDGYSYHGWLELDGKKYYLSTFDDDGNGYLDGRRFNGETREIDGVSYTFDANGVCTNCD